MLELTEIDQLLTRVKSFLKTHEWGWQREIPNDLPACMACQNAYEDNHHSDCAFVQIIEEIDEILKAKGVSVE